MTSLRCTNANIGTFNHECGRPAVWAGAHRNGHVQHFCDRCREQGDEATRIVEWRRLDEPASDPADRDLAFALATCGVDLDSPERCIRALHDAGFRLSAYRPALFEPRWSALIADARRMRADLDARREAERAAGFPSLAELAAAGLCLIATYGWVVVAGMRELV